MPAVVLGQSPGAEQLDERYRESGLAALVSQIPAGVQAGFDKAFSDDQGASLGMMAALPAEQPKPLEVIRNQLEQYRPQIKAAMENQTVLAFLFTYKELTADEIRPYLGFARSEVGARYHAASSDGIEQTLTAGSLKLGTLISEIVQATETRSEI
jgi:hypothetical protein